MRFRFVPLVAVSALFVGCAPIVSGVMNATTTDADVLSKTALYFDAKPQSVTISGIDKQALATLYRATYKGVTYNCKLYYGEVNCRRPGA
jgi:hypothetical protein